MGLKYIYFRCGIALLGAMLFVSTISRAFAQNNNLSDTQDAEYEYPATYTSKQLTNFWNNYFALPKYLQSADLSRGISTCLVNDSFFDRKSRKTLALLRLVSVIPGPISTSLHVQQYIYLFDVTFRNTLSNPLYKSWLDQLKAVDQLQPDNIARIAVMTDFPIRESNDTTNKLDPYLEFFIYSRLDVLDMPEDFFDNFIVLDKFGVDVGYTSSVNPSDCS